MRLYLGTFGITVEQFWLAVGSSRPRELVFNLKRFKKKFLQMILLFVLKKIENSLKMFLKYNENF